MAKYVPFLYAEAGTAPPPPPTLAVATTSLPNGSRGTAYAGATLEATGGTPPYTWSLVAPNNTLPTGMSFNTTTGALTGTPSVAGETSLVFRVSDDAAGTADSGVLTIIVDEVAALTITTGTTLAQGEEDTSYSRTLATTGGWGDKTWTKLSGDYPAGITLNGTTGVLSGTPTTAGTSVFTLRVEDEEARTDSRTFSITVVAAGLEGPHDYYDYWATQPEFWRGHTLRSQAALDGYVADATSTVHTYDPGNDTYPDAQDAAKFVIESKVNTAGTKWSMSVAGSQQLLLQTSHHTSGLHVEAPDTLFIAFDMYWAPETAEPFTGQWLNFWKTFQPLLGGDKTAWTGMHMPRTSSAERPGPEFFAQIQDHVRGSGGAYATSPTYSPFGMIRREPFTPLVGPYDNNVLSTSYWVKYGVWTRYMMEFRYLRPTSEFTEWNAATGGTLQENPYNPDGAWTMVSTWMADETRDPERIYWRTPRGNALEGGTGATVVWDYRVTRFKVEHNTSQSGTVPLTGAIMGYIRNLLVLNLGEDAYADESNGQLFRRPVR